MYVGNYENWAFAQPAKAWCVSSYKAVFDTLQSLDKMNLMANVKDGLTDSRGRPTFGFLDIKTSERNRPEFPSLTPGEAPPVSSRD